MHYYTNNVDAHSDEKSFNYRLRGYDFRFTTDVGVFSKKEVDFGSRLLIESFTVPEVEGDILDVGCGYGPIGLSLAKSYENRNIHMVDVNHRALELAKRNAKNNNILNVSIYESYCYERGKGEVRRPSYPIHLFELVKKVVSWNFRRGSTSFSGWWRVVGGYSKKTRGPIG